MKFSLKLYNQVLLTFDYDNLPLSGEECRILWVDEDICAILARNKNISLWISLIGILSLIGIIIVFCIHSHKNKCLNCGKKFNSKEKICPYCKTSVSIEEVFGEIKANNIR